MKTIATATLLAALTGQAWAVNKCTMPDGRVVFQDAPCANTTTSEVLKIRPASGHIDAARDVPPIAPPATSNTPPDKQAVLPPKPKTQGDKMKEQLANSQNERRKQELEVQIVPGAKADMLRDSAYCDQQIEELKQKKQRATNNLAGATWEQSISDEMIAISNRCESRAKERKAHYDTVTKECRELGGCR